MTSACHSAAVPRVHARRRIPLVAVAGNPNTGKTTIFNRLTGQSARVGNYPGVTVERRLGRADVADAKAAPTPVEVLDVPGCYSLTARSAEERIAIDAILGWNGNPRPDLVLVVLDATQLIRNLYLVLQIVEFGVPCIAVLNMIDEAGAQPPDPRQVERRFGIPCVATDGRRGRGMNALRSCIRHALREPQVPKLELDYPAPLRDDAERIVAAVPPDWPPGRNGAEPPLPFALWALSSIDEHEDLKSIPPALVQAVEAAHQNAKGRDLDDEIIRTRYAFLDSTPRPDTSQSSGWTERIDRLLLHPVVGFATFLLVMLVVFQSLFAWADPAIGAVEWLFGKLGQGVAFLMPNGIVEDLLVDGVIGGVGNVLVFLPQILLLFFLLGLMEDSGYMARVAYLMDRIMRSVGLHGRAFVPMLSGYACAIPAVLATRTMEQRRDRLLTMLVIPLMTCSARLPVYTLIIGALFPPMRAFGWLPVQGLLMVGMYVFSTILALVVAAVLGRVLLRGPRVPLLLELPPYRLPTLWTVTRMMWLRSKHFLTEAGSIILVCTIILWALLSFPRQPTPAEGASSEQIASWEAATMRESVAGHLGRAIEPIIEPLGFDWKIGVGIIGAFAAREVFVSTLGVIYGVGSEADETSMALREHMRAEARLDGKPVYSPLVGLSLMVFFALACQCMSTLAVIRRETHGWRWPAFLFAYMSVLAWVTSFAVYQGGRALGLE